VARRIDPAAAEAAPTATGLSEVGALVGTAGYMSPEQALGQDVDHRSDLFSFGVVLYELLAGRAPFRGPTSAAVLNAVLHDDPPAIARFNDAVPDPLAHIVAKLLEKDRDARYQTAREVYNDLRRLQHGEPSAAAAPSRRRIVPVAIGLAAAIVALAGAGVFWSRARSHASTGTASIVVLPAEISGPASIASYEYLKDAVPATLSTRLSAIDGLETKVPPTALEWEAAKRDVQQVVRAYAVQYYLSPHVYAEPERLAMTLQLVQADTRKMIWSHDYSGTPAGYQTLIGAAAEDLRGVLRPTSSRAPAGGERSSGSELAFQEGHYLWDRYNTLHKPEDFERAHAALERALALDPGNADAAGELAFLYVFRFEDGMPVTDALPEIERWTREALRISPHNGLALAVAAYMENMKPASDRTAMLQNALKAAFYAPRTPIVQNLLGISLTQGSLTLQIAAQQQSLSLDPLYRAVLNNLAGALYASERPADAIALVDAAIARQPDLASLTSTKIEPLLELGRIDEAQAIVDRVSGNWPPPLLHARQYALLEARHDPRAASLVDDVAGAGDDPKLTLYGYASRANRLVPFLAGHGRTGQALHFLEAGLSRHQWSPPYDQLMTDSRLAAVRNDPRFPPIREHSLATMKATLAALNDASQNGELPAYLVRPLADLRARFGF
jgi:serine/threonine-protein kinase